MPARAVPAFLMATLSAVLGTIAGGALIVLLGLTHASHPIHLFD